jgi:ApaG protein
MAEAKKYQIDVQVSTNYLAEQSEPETDRYAFSYTITITNSGTEPAQLISRHWLIAGADGKVQEVRGLGVVGHQPLLQPGQQFEYSSACVLSTAVGTMKGSYRMVAEDGTAFDAPIGEFMLSMPRTLH